MTELQRDVYKWHIYNLPSDSAVIYKQYKLLLLITDGTMNFNSKEIRLYCTNTVVKNVCPLCCALEMFLTDY